MSNKTAIFWHLCTQAFLAVIPTLFDPISSALLDRHPKIKVRSHKNSGYSIEKPACLWKPLILDKPLPEVRKRFQGRMASCITCLLESPHRWYCCGTKKCLIRCEVNVRPPSGTSFPRCNDIMMTCHIFLNLATILRYTSSAVVHRAALLIFPKISYIVIVLCHWHSTLINLF